MATIPKPELERGNYICYADEPGAIVSPGSGGGGGGGVAVFEANYDVEDERYVPEFSYNDVKSAWNEGKICLAHLHYDTGSYIQENRDIIYDIQEKYESSEYNYYVECKTTAFYSNDPDAIME